MALESCALKSCTLPHKATTAAGVQRARDIELDLAGRAGNRVCVRHRLHSTSRAMAAAALGSDMPPISFPPVGAEGRPRTILDALAHLQKTRKDDEELPDVYSLNKEQQPAVKHDEWSDLVEIPVIDLSRMETERNKIAKQLHNAATEWGFFQLAGHGLSLEEMRHIESQGFKFFELPAEDKEKINDDGSPMKMYIGDSTLGTFSSLHWAECLMVNKGDLGKIVERVWPGGNEEFSESIIKFLNAADRIHEQLLELLAESLGLTTDFFSQHLNPNRASSNASLRLNFYPACPRPADVLGATSHTDGCCLTVLQQDKVGGLQIQKDGQWLAIKPVEGALVVNIGDILHAWTNGALKSVLHRAVVNKSVHRLSFAAFMNVDKGLTISAPEELVDDSHPRLYRPFNFTDYFLQIKETRAAQSRDASRDGLLILDGLKLNKGK